MTMEKQPPPEDEAIGSTQSFGPYTFQWTPLHLPRSATDPLRHQYDELGAAALERLQEIWLTQQRQSRASTPSQPSVCNPRQMPDYYALLKEHHGSDEVLGRFWGELHEVPDWVDWDQLERGQRFFYRYAMANLMGFALQGFVGENSGASGVVEVLVRTGGFSTRVLLRRLLETFAWLLQATSSLSAIRPGGPAHISTVRVRLLHCAVRQRILSLVSSRPAYFDMAAYGIPVNDLDAVHSVATFACNHMWLQLPPQGVAPGEGEMADYVALHRYLGHLLGAPTTPYFADVERAKATMESMLVHELRVTETSRVVCHNFVKCLEDLPPFNVSRGFIEAGSRMLNGDGLCDELGMGRPGWFGYSCWTGHCWLVRALAGLQRACPKVDRWMIDFFRRTLHSAIIESPSGLAGGTNFEFKFVPKAGAALTGREDRPGKGWKPRFLWRPVEAFYFTVFLLGCLGLVSAAFVSYFLLKSTVNTLRLV